MPAESLNHYTIQARDVEKTKDFYEQIVGLKAGDRPPLNFPGYWLYCGDVPTVHLIGIRPEDPQIPDAASEPAATGRLDHIAFAATDVEAMRKRLQSKGVKFRESIVPRTGDTQFFLYDPDGVGVELNFPKA